MIDGRRLVALLLVGGAGTRLWPISTDARPKQFLKLFADRSLFQAALARLSEAAVDEIVIVSSAQHAATVREQAREVGIDDLHLLLEPCRRDSAAAISAGAAWIGQKVGTQALAAVLPTDHFVPDAAAFARALEHGAALALDAWLVTFGVKPTSPNTEYGYVQRGAPLASFAAGQACKAVKFHEKPRREIAEAYLRDGGYDWNSGIFVFTVDTFAEQAMRHMPDIWLPAGEAVAAGESRDGGLRLAAEAFARARKSSIDYALFERSDRVAVVPVDFEWHDIGNWGSAHDAFATGQGANLVFGDAVLDQVSGAVVVADGVKVVVCGLDDVVVVASREGAFVAPRSKAADIKRLLGD